MSTLPPPPSGDKWELDVEDAFGEHDIEYWVWSGNRLVPATPEQTALIREREALSCLRAWKVIQTSHAHDRAHTEPTGRLFAWLRGLPARALLSLVARIRRVPPGASGDAANLSQAGTPSDYSTSEWSAP
jgi:hypothetical protein